MAPAPPPRPFFAPLTSFFQDIGFHRRDAPIVVDFLPDPIAKIWEAEEAATAFEKGQLRSISFGDDTTEDNSSESDDNQDSADSDGDDDDSNSSESSTDGVSDSDSDDDLVIVFRNESPETLLLCWMSKAGEPYHFYRLKPSSCRKSKRQTQAEQQEVFEILDTDHLENTFPGHAFCLGYVQSKEEIDQVQKSKSLLTRQRVQTEANVPSQNNNGNIIVAGYRSFTMKSSSSSSSSSSSLPSGVPMISRQVQLVTISHDPPEEMHHRRRSLREKKTTCLRILPWCLESRKRLIHDDHNESECDDNDIGLNHSKKPLDLSGWKVSARWAEIESKPYDTTTKVYEERALGGWPCRLEPNWSNGDETSAQKLERDICAASLLLPPHARDYLQRHCRIWVNRSLYWGPSARPIRGNGCCYHPSKKWLVQNGLSGEKHMCVEVNDGPKYRKDCDLWGVGGVMLHELSHAYHHIMIPDGYENKEIKRCYEFAMKEGLYDSIEYHSAGCIRDGGTIQKSTAKAYASTNAMEYFAELSAAFLGGLDDSKEYNKWYPFNRKQIQEHDPRAYSMLSRLWKVN